MRRLSVARWAILLLSGPLLCATASSVARITRGDLIGAWRLVSIEFSGDKGPVPDPFYQTGSTGIIIYEPGGLMSVQIVAPDRRTWAVPDSRVGRTAPTLDAALEAAAFNTYYAYFGTWELDEARSVMIHHVQSSLIPSESGVTYSQTVSLVGDRLIFVNEGRYLGHRTVRKKIWERAGRMSP
jgi:hypothetical protein